MIEKHPSNLKSWLITATTALVLFIIVMWQDFADSAHKPFWWNFWKIIGILLTIGVVGGWVYWYKKRGK